MPTHKTFWSPSPETNDAYWINKATQRLDNYWNKQIVPVYEAADSLIKTSAGAEPDLILDAIAAYERKTQIFLNTKITQLPEKYLSNGAMLGRRFYESLHTYTQETKATIEQDMSHFSAVRQQILSAKAQIAYATQSQSEFFSAAQQPAFDPFDIETLLAEPPVGNFLT